MTEAETKRRAIEIALEVFLPILSTEDQRALVQWAKDQGVD